MRHKIRQKYVPRKKKNESADSNIRGLKLIALAGRIENATGIPCEDCTEGYLKWYVKKYGGNYEGNC